MTKLMPYLLCLLLAHTASLSGTIANAGEWRLLETDKVDLEYSQLNPHNRDPYAPNFTGKWRERGALKWDLSIARYRDWGLFWNNNIHTETIDSGAVKTVGWEWELGIQLGKYADLFHHHHSRHIMDEKPQIDAYNGKYNQFPVEDSLVLRIHLYRGK